jgi:hypothetical protein
MSSSTIFVNIYYFSKFKVYDKAFNKCISFDTHSNCCQSTYIMRWALLDSNTRANKPSVLWRHLRDRLYTAYLEGQLRHDPRRYTDCLSGTVRSLQEMKEAGRKSNCPTQALLVISVCWLLIFFFIQSFIKEAQKLVIMAHACNLKRRRQEDLNLKAS